MNLAPARIATTLVEGLVESAQERPYGVTFFPSTGKAIDMAELEEVSARRATRLLEQRLPAGTVVGLLMPDGPEFLTNLFGVLRAGLTVSVLPARGSDVARLGRLITTSGIRHLLVGSPFHNLARDLRSRCPEVSVLGARPSRSRTSMPQIHPEQYAVVQFTAGRTGPPKAVTLSHGAVMAAVRALRLAVGIGPADVLVQWLPPHRHMGLFGLLGQIVDGATTHVFTPNALRDRPQDVLRCIANRQGSITAGGNASYELLCDAMTSGLRGELDLSRWRVALNGGEPVRAQTIARFMNTFGPAGVAPSTPCPVYQLAEAALVITCKPTNTKPIIIVVDEHKLTTSGRVRVVAPGSPYSRPYVSTGMPVADAAVRITDDSGWPVESDILGDIQVSGTSLTTGYHRDLRTTVRSLSGSWLRTGDRGFLWNGHLFLRTDNPHPEST